MHMHMHTCAPVHAHEHSALVYLRARCINPRNISSHARTTTLWPHVTQVNGRAMAPSVVSAAQRIAKGKATPAQTLVDHDSALLPAVQYVFGNAFVCQVLPHLRSMQCGDLSTSNCKLCLQHAVTSLCDCLLDDSKAIWWTIKCGWPVVVGPWAA